MFGIKNSPPEEIMDIIESYKEKSEKAGLDPFTTSFEIVDYKQLNEIAAYGGFPIRYPHWRWGMEYERISKSYSYGLSIIYEMVINNDPCYAYLLKENSMVSQKTVIAHVYGHSDFFKNNFYFSKTNRKMLDCVANHAATVEGIINDVGQSEVESFIDICLSLENLIDIHSIFRLPKESNTDSTRTESAAKLITKPYMDSYVNPPNDSQKKSNLKESESLSKLSIDPIQDVLLFLIEHAPISSWQKRVLSIIRDEAYYFAPQAQTKILNEGWATYWHSKMMTETLKASEIVDYCDQFSSVIASQPGMVNPYRLGVELLRHVEDRWNKGRFGKNYHDIKDHNTKSAWNLESGLGLKKLFEIRKTQNDVNFIDSFLDEDFCHQTKMFLYDRNPNTGKLERSKHSFDEVKKTILNGLSNLGLPVIKVVDGNFNNRGELLLKHFHDGSDLKSNEASEVLVNINKLWKRPVYLETSVEKIKRRMCFDGSSQSIEKI